MSLKLKILHLLEETDGMCLDNKEERMEVAARLANGLAPAPPTNRTMLDELIDVLTTLKPRDWDMRGLAKWQVSVGDTDVVLLNTHTSADSLNLYVNRRKFDLNENQRNKLLDYCGHNGQELRDTILEKALRDLRTLK